MNRKALLVVGILVWVLNVGVASAIPVKWWNNSWHYRVNVTVNTSSYNRTDWPIEHWINFTALNVTGTFDENSTRVLEYNLSTGELMYEIPSQFDQGSGYSPTSNAVGEVVWLLNGTRPENTRYSYYIYFDTIENGAKEAPTYNTQLTYTNSSDEFWVNNSLLEIRVDTNRSVNYTSGIYYASFRDGNLIFDIPSDQDTLEYIKYSDGAVTYYWYDFGNNYTLVVNGSIRKIVEQIGDEKIWGTTTSTGEYAMKKRYTFYENNPWIKIEHNLTKIGSSETRASSDSAPALDTVRGFGTVEFRSVPSEYYASAYNPTSNLGLGVIDLNESGTPGNKYEVGLGLKGIYIWFNGFSVDSVSATAVVSFNNKSTDTLAHASVEELKDRLYEDVITTRGPPDAWQVIVEAQTEYPVYNLNETVNITGIVTNDSHTLNASANATLDMGTPADPSDDIVLPLYYQGNGNYTANYTFGLANQTGVWNLTIRVYDKYGYLLNLSSTTFNLTDRYSVSVSIIQPSSKVVLIDGLVKANVSVQNYINTTWIANANVTCNYTNGTDPKVVENITDNDDGTYAVNFTAPSIVYNPWILACNASKYNNTGYGEDYFRTIIATNTTLKINLTNDTVRVYNVTQRDNQSFLMMTNVSNIRNGTAYSPNITLSLPSTFKANVTFPFLLNNLEKDQFRVSYFNITVLAGTPAGNYTINATVNWANYDAPPNSTTDLPSVIEIVRQPILEVLETQLDGTVVEGSEGLIGNFTANSTGNYRIENVTASCISGSGEVCDNFTVSFYPNFTAYVNAGNWTNISVNVSVPEGYPPGEYNGTINVSSVNGGWDNLTLNITVPTSRNWNMKILESCSKTVLVNATGNICEVEINNTGNVNISFNISINPASGNFTLANKTNFTVNKTSAYRFQINYNTSNAAVDNTYTANYTVNATDADAIPDYQWIPANITVVLGPSVQIVYLSQYVEQKRSAMIIVNVTDRASNLITNVTATITRPDNTSELLELSNITANILGGSSSWAVNVTNTSLRGNYTVTVYANDNATGWGTNESKFAVYAKLELTIYTLADTYEQGDTGSFKIYIGDANDQPVGDADVNLQLIDPYNWLILNFSATTSADGKARPDPTFQLDSKATLGDYNWVANVTYYDDKADKWVNASASNSFKVVKEITGLPLYLDVDAGDVHQPGETVTIYAVVKDGYGILLPGANVSINVTAPNGSIIQENINATLDVGLIYKANFTLDTNASTGAYLVTAKATYGLDEANDIDIFVVSVDLFAEVMIPSVVYLDKIMTVSVITINPATGDGIDSDAINVKIYRTEGYSPDLWRDLSKSDFNITQVGFYTYSEKVDSSSVLTGSYLTVLEAKEGSAGSWDMEAFRILKTGPYDVIIEWIKDPVAQEEYLTFTINMTNMGEFVEEDVIISYTIIGEEKYNSSFSRAVKETGVPDVFNKTTDKAIDLAPGIYTLHVSVIYDPNAPPATASATFEVKAKAAAPPGGPGGAPGAPAAPPAQLNITDFYPSQISVEKGGTGYLTVTVENTGGVLLHNVSAELIGIPATWFQLVKGSADTLAKGKTLLQVIEIDVPKNITPQEFNITFISTSIEASDEKSLTLKVFESIEDLLEWEIDKVKENLVEVEDKTFIALQEGKNVTKALTILRDATSEIRRAEDLIRDKRYYDALAALESARTYLRDARSLIDKAMVEVTVITPPTTLPPTTLPPTLPPTPTIIVPPLIPREVFFGIIAALFILALMVGYFALRWSHRLETLIGTKEVLSRERKRGARAMPEKRVRLSREDELRRKREQIKKLLETIKMQHDKGIISDKPYEELTKKNEERLSQIDAKLP